MGEDSLLYIWVGEFRSLWVGNNNTTD